MEVEVARKKRYTQDPLSEQPSKKLPIDTSNDLSIQGTQNILQMAQTVLVVGGAGAQGIPIVQGTTPLLSVLTLLTSTSTFQ
jgi:hypothetical protein